MTNSPIDPNIQYTILEALPDDGTVALELMAQLSANMLLSIPQADLDRFVERVCWHYAAYQSFKGNQS